MLGPNGREKNGNGPEEEDDMDEDDTTYSDSLSDWEDDIESALDPTSDNDEE